MSSTFGRVPKLTPRHHQHRQPIFSRHPQSSVHLAPDAVSGQADNHPDVGGLWRKALMGVSSSSPRPSSPPSPTLARPASTTSTIRRHQPRSGARRLAPYWLRADYSLGSAVETSDWFCADDDATDVELIRASRPTPRSRPPRYPLPLRATGLGYVADRHGSALDPRPSFAR